MRAEQADFATRLRELRKRRGLRQADLAQAVGVAQTTIANYEKKLRFPDERMLGRFADFFDVSMDFLMGRSEAMRGAEAASASQKTEPPPISDAAAQYLELLRTQGIDAAMERVDVALRRGLSVQQVYLEILGPALRETGRLWERGDLGVGEEHTISEATQRIMSRVVPVSAPAVSGSPPPTCLACAVSQEQHTIGSRMVADFLRLDGWDVVFPRGNLSIRHVIEMLELRPPNVLALSTTLDEHVAEAANLISVVREHRSLRGVRIMVGGQAFHARALLWKEIGADGTATDAESAVTTANRVVGRQRP